MTAPCGAKEMVDEETIGKISQKQFDSYAAKHLHVKKLGKLHRRIRLVEWLAMAVPALYFVVRLTAKGTEYQDLAEVVWESLAGLLFAVTALKIALGWQEGAEKHSKLLGE